MIETTWRLRVRARSTASKQDFNTEEQEGGTEGTENSNSHFGPSGCHIVMAGLVPAIQRGTVLRGWPEQVRP
jgi:hypothetical protein